MAAFRVMAATMEAVSTSETSVHFYETTRCHIPKAVIFVLVDLKNLK
jgi:hypothetical protein